MLLLAAVSPFCAAQDRLRLHGSNTIGERLAPELVTAWLKSEGYREVKRVEVAFEEIELHALRASERVIVEIHAHGSSTGFKDLAAGRADIAMSSRPTSAADALPGVGKLDSISQEIVLALDGLAVVVHPSSPLPALSKSQLQAVFSGRVTDWATLGGRPGRIALHARDEKSGTWESFRTLVLGSEALATTATRYESTAQLAAAVAADPNAIGFVGLSGVQGVRALAVSDGGKAVGPTREEVAVEDYPLSRRLYFYLPQKPSQRALAFAGFALAAEGQAVAERVGFVSQNIRAYAGTARSDTPAEYQTLVNGARRLSLNFRFGAGDAFLDSKALRDLDRLAAFMQQPAQQDQRLLLLGFSDAEEALPVLAVFLSNERVDYIANRLIERGIDPARSRGMGGVAPVAANDTALGKQRNRRVEVWLAASGATQKLAASDAAGRRGAAE
jgi:phosphate transport system substrate-binding protein